MIRYLRGTVIEKLRNQLVIDIAGVGYDVFVTPQLVTLATIGSESTLFVAESIREDAHDLFGFSTANERASFELLRKVSGVGPKVSMAIVGFYRPDDLSSIVASGDVAKLSLVPGVGQKVAGKIIIELKGKMVDTGLVSPVGDVDTIEALQSLGYSPSEIAKVIPKIPADLTKTSERVTWVLRQLAN